MDGDVEELTDRTQRRGHHRAGPPESKEFSLQRRPLLSSVENQGL
jgi:hypothetical protein